MASPVPLLHRGATVARRRNDRDHEGDRALEDKIRQMLRDLGRALSDAIAESSDVNQALRRIQEEGYSLFIFLDRREREGANGDGADREGGSEAEAPARPRGEPVFRIHGGDLSFLRSIGIDPTRRVRSRRTGRA
jgi:hypothetical protein